jgi:hypothetical protein
LINRHDLAEHQVENIVIGCPATALSMLVGGLALMRATPDQETRNFIRDQITAAMRKLTLDETGPPKPEVPTA